MKFEKEQKLGSQLASQIKANHWLTHISYLLCEQQINYKWDIKIIVIYNKIQINSDIVSNIVKFIKGRKKFLNVYEGDFYH